MPRDRRNADDFAERSARIWNWKPMNLSRKEFQEAKRSDRPRLPLAVQRWRASDLL